MLKSCSYCGRIHDRHTVCQQKAAAISRRQHKSNDKITRFRNSSIWKDCVRPQALKRDLNFCRVCLADGYVNSDDIQVHHIVPMREDFSRRDDLDNLICLCSFHHEQAEAGYISRAELFGLTIPPEGSDDF